MKINFHQFLITVSVSFACLDVFAQGTVHFGGDNSTPIINGLTGQGVQAADGITAALYWSPIGSSNFVQLGSAVKVGIPLAGLFVGGTRSTGMATPGGGTAQFQVRAWEAAYGATYEEATAAPAQGGRAALIGQSGILQMPTGGASPPTPPTLLTAFGLKGFQVNPIGFAPTIHCPSDFVTEQAVVNFDLPAATGTPVPVVVCVPPSGSTLPAGTNVVTCAATNTFGAANCSFRVAVRDTEPPAILCPAGIRAEFADARGAMFTFSASAVDAQDGAVMTACMPPSGTMFPIGTNIVTCSAADASGNLASCSFEVTVLGARGVIEDVLADLVALQRTTEPEDEKRLHKAIRCLNRSLVPALWMGQIHLERRHGQETFNQHQAAVEDLCELMKDDQGPPPPLALHNIIRRIFKADRLLAWVAIQDASNAGAGRKIIKEALGELAAGDTRAAGGAYEHVVKYYESAWRHATYRR